jgi:hypothetical protein
MEGRRSLTTYERIIRQRLGVVKGPLLAERIHEILDIFRNLAIFDRRLFHFEVAGKQHKSGVVLTGEVSLLEMKTGLVALLRQGGIEKIEDKIVVLPDPKLKGRFLALVKKPVLGLFREPSAREEQNSQLFIGDAVEILKRRKTYCLAQGPDGYIGWIPSSGLCQCNSNFFQKWVSMPRVAFVDAVEDEEITIPIGAELPLVERGRVLLPDGREHCVREKCYRPLRWSKQPQRQVVVQMAQRFLGVPYLWGGKSMKGIDCSGLIQVAYRSAGIYLARDANQQFLSGRLVATRNYCGEILPADLIFFTGPIGNISHTAISLGGGQYIHASSSGVTINSFDPNDREHDPVRARSFVYAKRLIQ